MKTYLVFDIEDNLPERVEEYSIKKNALTAFKSRLIQRGLIPKEIHEAVKSSLWMGEDITIQMISSKVLDAKKR